jgi:lipopolysaccharide export system protein LptC
MTTLAPLGPSKVRERQPLIWRVQRWVSNWTPLVLMALLALFSTWLVKQTPLPEAPRGELLARGKPDYEMRGFELQRFAATGGSRAWLRGDVLRHYPQGDRIEILGLRLRAQAEDGSWLLAEAAQAEGPLDGSLLQLRGGVVVRRYATGVDPDAAGATPLMRMTTAELQVEDRGERLSSRSPTEVLTPRSQMKVAGFRYEHAKNLLRFSGPSQITLPPRR